MSSLAQSNESQAYVYDENIVHLRYDEQTLFLGILNVPHEHLPGSSMISNINGQVTLDTFLAVANVMAKSIRDLYFVTKDQLMFKSTESKSLSGHVTVTNCIPDYVAAFKSDWGDEIHNDTMLWPCIQLVGEKASQGKKLEDQESRAMSHLYYLLLARPDLWVAQGVLTSDSAITFLLGIGGAGILTFSLKWEDKELHNLLYAFIYRLYDPGDFVDPSYVEVARNPQPRPQDDFITYSLQITGTGGNPIVVTNLRPIYASNPFGSRTHILTDPNSKTKINGKQLTAIKDQLYRVGTRFHEHDILTQVHSSGKVPGVVEAIHHEEIDTPKDFCSSRKKHRLGLQQMGKSLAGVPTVLQLLEIIFDILEVLRYLRFERNVLHRDITNENVLYVEDNPPSSTPSGDKANNIAALPGPARPEGQNPPLCFIKYLLDESNDPTTTSALLIDFNHAEDLGRKCGPEHDRISRTGAAAFVARAVQLGGAMPQGSKMLDIPEVPMISGRYGTCHPDRIAKYQHLPRELIPNPTGDTSSGIHQQWRHELDHDTESVFWVLLYCLMSAQPKGGKIEPIDAGVWGAMTGSVLGRTRLLLGGLDEATHSVYRPLWPMLSEVARIFVVDKDWIARVRPSDPRSDPGYANEAFRRLILQFILDHHNEPFMRHRVESQPRLPELIPGFSSDFSSKKRSLSEPTTPDEPKRLRMPVAEDPMDGDESDDQLASDSEVEETWVGLDEEG